MEEDDNLDVVLDEKVDNDINYQPAPPSPPIYRIHGGYVYNVSRFDHVHQRV